MKDKYKVSAEADTYYYVRIYIMYILSICALIILGFYKQIFLRGFNPMIRQLWEAPKLKKHLRSFSQHDKSNFNL